MTTTTPAIDPLRPRPPGGMGRGATLALLVHLGLVAALAVAVRWHTSEPAGVSAELWAAVPQAAAPREEVAPPPPPPPPPKPAERQAEPQREAEIAIEKARKEKLQKERAEREKAEREKAERDKAEKEKAALERKKEDEEKRLAKLREENLKRMQGLAGATGGPTATGSAQQSSGPSASYAGRIIASIEPNIIFTDDLAGNPRAEVELRAAPDGTILARKIVKSSGSKDWDEAVLRAIDRTARLPRDVDGSVPSPMVLGFRPKKT